LRRHANVSNSIPEAPTKLIAQNNLLASQEKHDNPYLAQRLFESTPTLKATEKLFEYQASIIKRNRYAIDLRCLKYDGVARSTAQVLAENPSPTTSAYVNGLSAINAATHTKCGSDKASIKELLSLLEKRPNDVGLVLTIIQLYILAHNPGAATALLESFFKRLEESATASALDVRFAPGLVALIVSLYRLQGRKGPIKAQLGNAASYWSKKSAPSEDLLKAAGLTLLESSNPADLKAAADFFGSLREKDPADPIAVAGYIAAVATTDLSLVSADLTRLSPIDKLIGSTDAAALEDAGIASLPLTMTEIGRKRAAAPAQEKPKKKRVRRSERPKDYVEGRQMDPERWLPLKDRSTYRPKGKKGKKKAAEATQGGVVREEETMELAGGAGVVKVQTAPSKAGKKKKGKK
jgi:signal recognition particle subunit SRP72